LMLEDKKLAVSLDVDHNPLPQLHTAILCRGRALDSGGSAFANVTRGTKCRVAR
jgi:hypothetical protein